MKDLFEKAFRKCKERWYLVLLAGVFLLALKIRLLTADLHWLQAYDPYFHLRYTSYVFNFGKMPVWDPLSYFPPGRPIIHPPLMYTLTAYLYKLFQGSVSSLMEFAKYSTAFYGAAMTIPAYLLGKEFSDWRAGVVSAVFIGTIPAALRRTMAGFYDTDALVLFFTILTIYFIARSFKKRDWTSYTLTAISMILFNLAWMPAWYVMMLAIGSTFVYLAVLTVIGREDWDSYVKKKGIFSGIYQRFNRALPRFVKLLIPVIAILIISTTAAKLLGRTPFETILNYVGFVTDPS
ncbi:MAG: STT3 domain-containing protein, partial [Candidatus Aenigmatarchaeota archaeon]